MARPKWTKTNFELIGRVVCELEPSARRKACALFIRELAGKNEEFNSELFRQACGVYGGESDE